MDELNRIIWILGWFAGSSLLAWVVRRDASRRGLNGNGWALGVVVLAFIFVPLYFYVREDEENYLRTADLQDREDRQ